MKTREYNCSREALLTKRDVAKWLSISVRSLERLVASGGFPAGIKLGRMTRWRVETIEAYLLQQSS